MASTYGTTGTGLDQLIDIIRSDAGLLRTTSTLDMRIGANVADDMNVHLIRAIRATGVANDGDITTSDVLAMNDWLVANRTDPFMTLTGVANAQHETGFQLIENEGGKARLFGRDAIDDVMDALYSLGFERDGTDIDDANGKRVESASRVAYFLDELLAEDLAGAGLRNRLIDLDPQGTTGTGLDRLVDMIVTDVGLNESISSAEIAEGARAADSMNRMVMNAIKFTAVAIDGHISAADVKDMADFIQAAPGRRNAFIEAHGDDEAGIETGFHLIQGDGAATRFADRNAIDTVADGIYHLVFGYDRGALINEDGNRNASLEDVADWLNLLLADDLADGSLVLNADKAGSNANQMARAEVAGMAAPEFFEGVSNGEVETGGGGRDTFTGTVGDDSLNGGYGDDSLSGGDGWDVLNGGRGADLLVGGAGNDVLVSESDAGIPRIGQLVLGTPTRPDPDGDVDYTTFQLKGYAGQPKIADDALIGGEGADVFLFRPLLNAKEEIIRKHADADGDIAWNKVAGENAALHDHWVDGFGFDTILDYVAGEDAIVIDGHTAHLHAIDYEDVDGDGRTESILTVVSRQHGNGGAHTHDLLGTITVFGDRVDMADVTVNSAPTYGIVDNVSEIAEALNPGGPRKSTFYDTRDQPGDPVSGDPFANIDNRYLAAALADEPWTEAATDTKPPLAEGTISVTFAASKPNLDGWQVLWSNDPAGSHDGGTADYATLYVDEGRLIARIVTAEGTDWLGGWDIPIEGGTEYTAALTFDATGVTLWLNGQKIDDEATPFALAANFGDATIGGIESHRFRNVDHEDGLRAIDAPFEGRIVDATVHERVLSRVELAALGDGPINTASVGRPNVISNDMPTGYGTGLNLKLFDADTSFANLTDFDAFAAGPADLATVANKIDFGGARDHASVKSFLNGNVRTGLREADGIEAETFGLTLDGYIYLPEGTHDLQLFSDDGASLSIGDTEVIRYEGTRGFGDSKATITTEAGLYRIAVTYFENGGGEGLRLDINGDTVGRGQFWRTQADFNAALNGATRAGAIDRDPELTTNPSTGTGLDVIVETILTDPGLEANVARADVVEAAKAADRMNTMLIDVIEETGVAADGVFSAADVMALVEALEGPEGLRFRQNNGEDRGVNEVRFQLVEDEGGRSKLFGYNAIDTVADHIYNLGFGHEDRHVLTESGSRGAWTGDIADWLNALLAEELTDGTFSDPMANALFSGNTGTGLDALVDIIREDEGLNRNVSTTDIITGARAANNLNNLYLDGIRTLELTDDGRITASDVYALDEWVGENHNVRFVSRHGNDEGDVETEFHLVQGDGATSRLFGRNAVDSVADAIYHIGFGTANGRLTNEDGDANERVETVAFWLNTLLADDIAAGLV